jgi:hypothetical protein
MSTDPMPEANPADVAEQEQETVPPDDGEEALADHDELPVEANEADVVEQHVDVPGWGDDEDES